MHTSDWTVVLSGPLAQRGPLLAALRQAGVDLSEPQPTSDPSHGLPTDASEGWVTCRHHDVDETVTFAARAGWALRAHWPTPVCRACGGVGKQNMPDGTGQGPCLHCRGTGVTNRRLPSPEELLRAELDSVNARLAALEGRR